MDLKHNACKIIVVGPTSIQIIISTVISFRYNFVSLQDPDLAKLLCGLKFVSKLGSANPDTTFCENLKVCRVKKSSTSMFTEACATVLHPSSQSGNMLCDTIVLFVSLPIPITLSAP